MYFLPERYSDQIQNQIKPFLSYFLMSYMFIFLKYHGTGGDIHFSCKEKTKLQ